MTEPPAQPPATPSPSSHAPLAHRPLAHGIDAVEVDRIRSMLTEHGERFLTRCFTPAEAAHGRDTPRYPEHLAARFAAKEAILKALGTGWADGIAWTDVEVRREPSGQPTVALHGPAAKRAHTLGLDTWALSLTHTSTLAIASVVAMGTGPHTQPTVAPTPSTPAP